MSRIQRVSKTLILAALIVCSVLFLIRSSDEKYKHQIKVYLEDVTTPTYTKPKPVPAISVQTRIPDPDRGTKTRRPIPNLASHFTDAAVPGLITRPSGTTTLKNKDYAVVPEVSVSPLKFRIYSHNVKNGGHARLVPGELPWSYRVSDIVASIKFNVVPNTILTLQEVYKFQLDDIMKELNRDDKWAAYGAGRINGEEVGEFVPIIYRPSEWEMVFNDTVWLNEKNPRKSLEGWDAKYLRIVSYVTLKHKQSGNYMNFFNTHFDHIGLQSRIGSAKEIVSRMEKINQWPSFLSGDLNSEPTEETYTVLTEKLQDSSSLATEYNRYGYRDSSVTGFEDEVLNQGGQNIDYIFSPSYAMSVEQTCVDKVHLSLEAWAMLHSKFGDFYMSDHRPIMADYLLQKCE